MKTAVVFLCAIIIILISLTSLQAQDPSAITDLESTTQGFLLPRMTMAERDAIATPATGLIVYQTDGQEGLYFNAGTPGSPEWVHVNEVQSLIEDAGQNNRVQVFSDRIEYKLDNNNAYTMRRGAGGQQRLEVNQTGNILIGSSAGDSLGGNNNIGIGTSALQYGSTNAFNIGLGTNTLRNLIDNAYYNIAIGYRAMESYGDGDFNIALGSYALHNQKSGTGSVAVGAYAGSNDTNSVENVLIGFGAGKGQVGLHAKENNVMVGYQAGYNNTGSGNVLIGYAAAFNEVTNNKLFIENSSSSTPLIYGSFDGDSVVINGRLGIYGNYVFPSGDGSMDEVLHTDGNGNLSWDIIENVPRLYDSDNNGTEVQISKGFIDNELNFSLGGTEQFRMVQNDSGIARLEVQNNSTNILIGYNAGENNNSGGYGNIGIGSSALENLADGGNNVAIGNSALDASNGSLNVAIGNSALFKDKDGTHNVVIGASAGERDTSSSQNVYIGFQAGRGASDHSKSGNVMIGNRAGRSTLGDGNVMIGDNAGSNELGSDKLYIDNSSASSSFALIYGEFDNNWLRINDQLGVGREPETNALEVDGDASKSAAGDWLANSDRRLKKNVEQMSGEEILSRMLQLRGVTYEWDDDRTGTNRPEGLQYGLIAQDIQIPFPTLVSEDAKGYLQTGYGTYDAMYIEIIRYLSERLDQAQTERDALREDMDAMEKMVSRNGARLQVLENQLVE